MWVYKGWHPFVFFAAPMVGASPDNMGAQRLAEGGVPTIGAGSVTKQANNKKNWNLTPINQLTH
jgi:hypothetical protein